MSTLDCARVHDAAPEFALGVLDAESRADLVQHIDRCSACRAHVAELAEAGDAIMLLAPEAEPPAGFEQRALDAMIRPERRRRWRTPKLVAVAAAAAAILSVVTVRIIDERRAPSTTVAAPTRQTVAMIGANGLRVGDVQVAGGGDTLALTVTVDYALDDGAYLVVIDPTEGARRSLGTVEVTGGKGSWTGTVPTPTGTAGVSLVDSVGRTRCSAELPLG